MKYLIATLLLTLSMSISAGQTMRTKVICEEGYKFLLVWNSSIERAPSVVQIYKEGTAPARPPQPIACK